MLAFRTNSALVDPVVQLGQARSWPADFDYLSFWWIRCNKERWILSCRLVVSVALACPFIKQKLLVRKKLKGRMKHNENLKTQKENQFYGSQDKKERSELLFKNILLCLVTMLVGSVSCYISPKKTICRNTTICVTS